MKGPTYAFDMRRIARPKESPKQLYAEFARRLGKVETDCWTIDPGCFPPLSGKEPEYIWAVSLTGAVSPRSVCGMHFQVRPTRGQEPLEDHPISDDVFSFDFPAKLNVVADFVAHVAKRLVAAFRPYVAGMSIDDVVMEDQPRTVLDRINNRYTVLRLHPFQYLSRTLCKRSFGLAPSEVVRRIQTVVDDAELFQGGVFYNVPGVFDLDETNEINERLKRAVLLGTALRRERS